ncbi:hypothetical protein [Fructilactobacillus sanfranciscensis]|uniref:hypothetical protein n=1 Tax=Fructilactobacillus sanfranciscensis TaxID=1625 RepID=UPI001456CACE|nr:hypothetical protein [Fructilactobacillus sanfranciscensis]
MEKIAITLNPQNAHTLQLLANAKGITVAAEIESIIAQHFAKPELIGMPELVGTEISGNQLQADGIVKLNGVLYFYQIVGSTLKSKATYVVADVTNQKVYLVDKGEYHARN